MAPFRPARPVAMFLLVLAALPALAADPARPPRPAPIDVPHVSGEMEVDGKLDEPLWQQARKFELSIETRPSENTPAKVKTTAYVAENGANLLIAFEAEDPDPSQIRAYLRDRDSAYGDDFIGIISTPSTTSAAPTSSS